jgi:hypothetical protein
MNATPTPQKGSSNTRQGLERVPKEVAEIGSSMPVIHWVHEAPHHSTGKGTTHNKPMPGPIITMPACPKARQGAPP